MMSSLPNCIQFFKYVISFYQMILPVPKCEHARKRSQYSYTCSHLELPLITFYNFLQLFFSPIPYMHQSQHYQDVPTLASLMLFSPSLCWSVVMQILKHVISPLYTSERISKNWTFSYKITLPLLIQKINFSHCLRSVGITVGLNQGSYMVHTFHLVVLLLSLLIQSFSNLFLFNLYIFHVIYFLQKRGQFSYRWYNILDLSLCLLVVFKLVQIPCVAVIGSKPQAVISLW